MTSLGYFSNRRTINILAEWYIGIFILISVTALTAADFDLKLSLRR